MLHPQLPRLPGAAVTEAAPGWLRQQTSLPCGGDAVQPSTGNEKWGAEMWLSNTAFCYWTRPWVLCVGTAVGDVLVGPLATSF